MARSAASKVPGDMEVSASSRTIPSLRARVANLLHIVGRMAERDHVEGRGRRLLAREHLETLVLQRLVDGAQPVRPFRMPGRGQVIEAGRVGDQEGRHECRQLFKTAAIVTPI